MNFRALNFELVDAVVAAYVCAKMLLIALQQNSIPGSPAILTKHATMILLYAGGIRLLARFKAKAFAFLTFRVAALYVITFLLFGGDPLQWLKGQLTPFGVDVFMGLCLIAELATGATFLHQSSESHDGNLP